MNISRSSLLRGCFGSVVLAIVFAIPGTVQAHGELELRIAAATRQIGATTNNLGELYLGRGELHREHKDWEAAQADYDRAEKLDPKLDVDFCRAQMLSDADRLEPARLLFDKVLERSSKKGEAFIGRARVLARLGRNDFAATDFQQAMELLAMPEPEYFLEWAKALMADGKLEEALRSLDYGMKKLGASIQLQSYAVELELGRKNAEAALSRLDVIVKEEVRKENWLAQRAKVLLAAGRKEEARKSFQESLAAIDRLPRLLRQGPSMQKLKAEIYAVLSEMNVETKVAAVSPD